MNAAWDDLKTVLAISRSGTLAAAAKSLGLNYTTVARRVDRIEAALGEKLFQRLASGYQPTESGALVARYAAEMEQADHALMRDLTGRDRTLSGPLTVTAPQLMIAHVLGPMLAEFGQKHPGVDLHLKASNDILDLTRREADVAIRISRTPGDTLKGLRLTEQQAASFASPEWADRLADDPGTMVDWLVYERLDAQPKKQSPAFPNARVTIRFDDMVAMAGAAAAGLGVVRMPMFLGRRRGGLVQVPVLPPQPYADVWIVAHPDVWPSAKVVAFREIVVDFFRRNRALFVA